MQGFKKITNALIYPPLWLRLILIPAAAALLIFSMLKMGTEHPVSILSYVISAYTLAIWCVKIPSIVLSIRNFKEKNKYIVCWRENPSLRIKVSLYGTLTLNGAYGILQLGLGIYHASLWFYTLAVYYFLLGGMRFFLLKHTRRHKPGEDIRSELLRYRACGYIFLFMNFTLSVMVFFMIYFGRSSRHSQVTAIAMALYTFTAFTLAIINTVKYKKYNSPVFTATKAIGLASASVSMITLTSTMLASFGGGDTGEFRKIILSALGGAVAVFIIGMSAFMIRNATKKLKEGSN